MNVCFLKDFLGEQQTTTHELALKRGLPVDPSDGAVIKPGNHVYPFRFQLPQQNLPPSFEGFHGWVRYALTVKLSRPWKSASSAHTELNFVLRNDGISDHLLQPQCGTQDKKMKLFGSGKMSMAVKVEKTGYMQGETIRVFVDIENSSSRDVKLKYCLKQQQTFIGSGNTKRRDNDIIKDTKGHISSGEKSKLEVDMTVPHDLAVSFENCRIIKVQYELKVYLDVSFSSDPEVKFPVVILQQQCPLPPAGLNPSLPDPDAGAGVCPHPDSYADPIQPDLHPEPSSPADDPNHSESSHD